MKSKKANFIHLGLIIIAGALVLAFVLELKVNGLKWFAKHDVSNENAQYVLVSSKDLETAEWDPYREMEKIHKGLDKLFNSAYQNAEYSYADPRVDLSEDEKYYIIKCDLPGMEKDKINISMESNFLTISGSREFSKEEAEKGKFYYKERQTGFFKRTIQLPGSIDEKNIKAAYDKGILTINIKKIENSQRFEVKKVQII